MESKRVLVIALGTEGDVRPAAALCAALVKSGLQAAAATHTDGKNRVESAGATFFDIGMGMGVARAETAAGQRLTTAGIFGKISASKEFLQPLIREYATKSLAAMREYNPDLVLLSTLAAWMSFHAARHVMGGTDRIMVYHLMPMAQSRQLYPCIGMAKIHPVRWPFLCGLAWSGTAKAAWPLYRDPLQQSLASEGVDLQDNPADFQTQLPLFLIYSPALFPLRPADWPASVQVVGSIAAAPEPEPAAALAAFVQDQGRSKPLLFLGLGSMLKAVFTPEQQASILQALVRAAELAEARAVVQCSDLSQDDCPDGVFLAQGSLPHRWLFSRCRVVVTHGGAGTVHTSLSSGCPVAVVPCETASDQAFWGEAAAAAGVGRVVVAASKLGDGRHLGSVLHEMLRDDELKRKAEQLAEKMAGEDGMGAVAGHVLSALQR